MSFIDDSTKNTKKYSSSFKELKKLIPLLKEVTAAGAAGGFVGRAGMGVDDLFAGAYHPDSGHGSKNLELLKKQIEDRKKKIKDTDSFEPNPIGGWYKTDTETNRLAFEELFARIEAIKQFNIDNTPPQDTEWKSTGVNIDYDDIYTHIENEEDFINKSETNMQHVNIDIKYDDEPEYAGEDFINKSKTNWKLVGRK